MGNERHGLLSRWAGLPLRAHILLAGSVALAAALLASLMKPAHKSPPTAASPALPKEGAFPVRLAPDQLTESEANREVAPISDGYRREVVRPMAVKSIDPGASSAPGDPPVSRRDDRKTLPELFHMPAEPKPPKSAETGRSDGGAFAPFGRLIGCVLVNTLDSATARAEPIVALVTRDLAWNGAVIVPAGTEAFSYARPEAVIDAGGAGRLIDSGEWILVFPSNDGKPNGRELVLKGRAVDRREAGIGEDGRVRSWGIDDGADGLVGYAISTVDDREIKLFATAAVSGLARGFGAIAERQQTASGLAGALGATQVAPTIANAAIGSLGQGAADVANELAGRIRQEIARRGVYIRVPAGKEFYLYVEQTIDPAAAVVGLRLPAAAAHPP